MIYWGKLGDNWGFYNNKDNLDIVGPNEYTVKEHIALIKQANSGNKHFENNPADNTPILVENVVDNISKISRLKQYLFDTDYVALKIAEGVATAEEYAEVLSKRQAARLEINELES